MLELVRKSAKQAPSSRVIKPPELANLTAADFAGAWLIVREPDLAELKQLADALNLDEQNLRDALDPDEAPRLEYDDKCSYLYLRAAHLKKDGSTDTRPLLLIYNQTHSIAILPSVPTALDELLSADSEFTTARPQDILLELLTRTSADFDIQIKNQSLTIKKIFEKMRTHKLENEDFIGFVMIEDQINNFRGALTPLTPLIRRVESSKHLSFTQKERDELEDITLAVEQSVRLCDTNAARIVSVREAYSTLSNNSLNRTMKALTAATLFIALPNVVFGMYGMNVALPLAGDHWAFAAILSGTLLAVAVIIFVAKKRHWF